MKNDVFIELLMTTGSPSSQKIELHQRIESKLCLTPLDTKAHNDVVEKKGTYTPNLRKSAAVPPTLGEELRRNYKL